MNKQGIIGNMVYTIRTEPNPIFSVDNLQETGFITISKFGHPRISVGTPIRVAAQDGGDGTGWYTLVWYDGNISGRGPSMIAAIRNLGRNIESAFLRHKKITDYIEYEFLQE